MKCAPIVTVMMDQCKEHLGHLTTHNIDQYFEYVNGDIAESYEWMVQRKQALEIVYKFLSTLVFLKDGGWEGYLR